MDLTTIQQRHYHAFEHAPSHACRNSDDGRGLWNHELWLVLQSVKTSKTALDACPSVNFFNRVLSVGTSVESKTQMLADCEWEMEKDVLYLTRSRSVGQCTDVTFSVNRKLRRKMQPNFDNTSETRRTIQLLIPRIARREVNQTSDQFANVVDQNHSSQRATSFSPNIQHTISEKIEVSEVQCRNFYQT